MPALPTRTLQRGEVAITVAPLTARCLYPAALSRAWRGRAAAAIAATPLAPLGLALHQEIGSSSNCLLVLRVTASTETAPAQSQERAFAARYKDTRARARVLRARR